MLKNTHVPCSVLRRYCVQHLLLLQFLIHRSILSRSSSISRMTVAFSSVNSSYFEAIIGVTFNGLSFFGFKSSSFVRQQTLLWKPLTNFSRLIGHLTESVHSIVRYCAENRCVNFTIFSIMFVLCTRFFETNKTKPNRYYF